MISALWKIISQKRKRSNISEFCFMDQLVLASPVSSTLSPAVYKAELPVATLSQMQPLGAASPLNTKLTKSRLKTQPDLVPLFSMTPWALRKEITMESMWKTSNWPWKDMWEKTTWYNFLIFNNVQIIYFNCSVFFTEKKTYFNCTFNGLILNWFPVWS